MENKIRTFICIDFPDEVIKEVARVQSLIKNAKFTGKLTELENLHLTLKFLGETEQENLENVDNILSSISFPKFEAKLENIGTFSYKNNPKIVWIKIGSKEIFELQKQIDISLTNLFKQEERFMSHLTIARIKNVKDKKGFEDHIKKISIKPISFEVKSFKLKSSELKPMGPVYRTLAKYELIK